MLGTELEEPLYLFLNQLKIDMYKKYIKLFLRVSIAVGFLSAVADRFGFWPAEVSAWGNWDQFVDYTAVLNPWAGHQAHIVSIVATIAEIVLALMLLVGYKTRIAAVLSGLLLLSFAIAMVITTGIKAPLDYSVLTASAAAFGLSLMPPSIFELDTWLARKRQ